MRTEAQQEASRINGAKSRGPVSPEGKAISSQNSTRHGQTAKGILLTIEDPEAFNEFGEAFFRKFTPIDEVEKYYVDEMMIARWRMQRDWMNETSLLDLQMDRQMKENQARYSRLDHACEYALAFKELADTSHALQLNARYEANHRRAFYRAFKGLMELRAMMKNVPPVVEEESQPAAEPTTPPQPEETTTTEQPKPEQQQKCETNPRTPAPAATNNGAGPTNSEEPHQPDRRTSSTGEETRDKN